MKVTMAAEYVSTRDAAALLGEIPLQYSAVHYLARHGLLQRIEVSPRRMFYQRAAVSEDRRAVSTVFRRGRADMSTHVWPDWHDDIPAAQKSISRRRRDAVVDAAKKVLSAR